MVHQTIEAASAPIGQDAAESASLGEFCCDACGLKHTWIFYRSMCCGARVVKIGQPSPDFSAAKAKAVSR